MEITDIMPTELVTDVAPAALAVKKASECVNVDFFAGRPRSLSQLQKIWTPLDTPKHFGFYEYGGTRRWAYGAASGLYTFDGTNQADVTPVGLTGSEYWDSTAFNGYGIFTNGIPPQDPVYLDAQGAYNTDAVSIPGWDPTWSCKLIRAHRNHLIAINLVEAGISHPTRVRWSESGLSGALPAGWIPAVSNDAGAYDPSVPGGEIIDAASLGDTMFLGGRGGLWTMTWTGGQYVYRFEQRSTAHGLRNVGCIVSMGDSVAVLTQTDLVQIDSTSERSLMIGRVARTLFNTIGKSAKLIYVDQSRQLIVLYGVGNETGYTRALTWDRDTDTWGMRVFSSEQTAAGKGLDNRTVLETTYDALAGKYTYDTWLNRGYYDRTAYASDAAFYVMGEPGAVNAPGGLYSWKIARNNIRLNEKGYGRVFALRAILQGAAQTVTMRLGSTQSADESITWGEARNYTFGTDELYHHDIQRGQFISYELSGNGQCQMAGLELEWKPQGRNR